ncbi:uncharacterized protein BX664DRAFT_324015 [Halteromyces radiatus]|uniref:uncharacterized protein n=1 Tax=Halteromyces radiatus TaxID=101107 RepID=UPI00221FC8AC|nr:uncharacterized protein BX664DRAFT_324015 [Halteromyces radiatus]KAI8096444.1 hypothetical protein BX664DRAFT_324015 [Halteromyces radiatus]
MHFIFEALHRRPLESKSLARARGFTAVLMSCCFLAYFGYLLYQIYADQTLLLISTSNIPDTGYTSPDIEMCVVGSDFAITSCALIDMAYNETVVPGCAGFINPGSSAVYGEWCKVFQANDSRVMFGTEGNMNLVRRVDIYWSINNVTAVSASSLAMPNVAITTYAQEFSPWRISPFDIQQLLPEQKGTWNSLQLQKYVSTSSLNDTTMIYFEPSRYRALKRNALSVIGLNNTFYDIDSIQTNQYAWELNHLSPDFEKYGNYQGQFGLALKTSNFQVQTEQRQHTVLSLLALGGGAYGAMTALYILLFGTPRLTPFGVSHNLSMWFYRGRSKLSRSKNHQQQQQQENYYDTHHITNEKTIAIDEEDLLSSTRPPSDSDVYELMYQDSKPLQQSSSSSLERTETNRQLESRVEELEMILREYFLNVEYLDALRLRRQEALPVYQQNPSNPTPTPRKSITGKD